MRYTFPVLILPVRTRLVTRGDSVADLLADSSFYRESDVIVVSSKILATAEGAMRGLATLKPSDEAVSIATETRQDPRFVEAILQETTRLNGSVRHHCPGAVLTELKPGGMRGSILIANAGLDQSNAEADAAIGWPRDPARTATALRGELERRLGIRLAVIVSDSCSLPRRKGVVAIALACSGIDPLLSLEGVPDLRGRPLSMTTEAVADQLATAGNAVMGNAGNSTPAAIIRDHGLSLSEFSGWVPGIGEKEDLFRMG